MLFFFFLNHIGSNGFLLIDRACIGSFAFFYIFPFSCQISCFCLACLLTACLHLCVCVSSVWRLLVVFSVCAFLYVLVGEVLFLNF